MALGVPQNQRLALQRARAAVEDGEVRGFQIVQNFALERVEVEIHVCLSQHQNITGRSGIAGGRRDDAFRVNEDLAALGNRRAHVGFADEIHRLRRGRNGRMLEPFLAARMTPVNRIRRRQARDWSSWRGIGRPLRPRRCPPSWLTGAAMLPLRA